MGIPRSRDDARDRSLSEAVGWLAMALVFAGAAFAAGPPYDPVVFEELEKAGVRFVVDPSRTAQKHQPETMIAGRRALRLRQRRPARHLRRQRRHDAGPREERTRFRNRLFRNKGDWTLRGRDGAGRRGRQGLRAGRRGRRLRQRRRRGPLRGRPAGEHPLPQQRRRHASGRDGRRRASRGRDPEYGTLWAVAAAFVDYDRDGWLDLFVSNYCVWDPQDRADLRRRRGAGLLPSRRTTRACRTRSIATTATGRSRTCRWPRASARTSARAWGIGVADFDEDGWVGLLRLQRHEPAFLFRTSATARASRRWPSSAGSPTPRRARPISGMGADARDIDNDGRPDIFQTALDGETMPLFRNRGGGVSRTAQARRGSWPRPSRTGWSNGIYDFNNDGWKDLFVAGGGVMDPKGDFAERAPQRQRRLREPEEREVRGRLGEGGRRVRQPQGRPPRRRLRRPRQRRPRGRRGERPRGAARDLAQRQPGAEPLAARRDRRDEEQP